MSREVIDIRTFDREIADRAAGKLEKETVSRPTALIVQSRIGRPGDSVRYQQPHSCVVLETSLANERSEVNLGILVGIRSAKSEADGSISRHGPLNGCRGVLLIGKLTFPFSTGASVGADEIVKLRTT